MIPNNLSLESAYEIINDAINFHIILEIKKRLKNDEAKEYLTMFLITVAPIFANEFAYTMEKIGNLKSDEIFTQETRKKIKEKRHKIAKEIIVKSPKTSNIINEMGIDFQNKRYDINIVLNDGKIATFNFENNVNENFEDDFEFWNSICTFQTEIIYGLIRKLNINIDFLLDGYNLSEWYDISAKIIDEKTSFKCYSYSAYKLFSNATHLSEEDKIFIMYRYRLVSVIKFIETCLPTFSIAQTDISSSKFIRKYKAFAIEVIGKELKNLNTDFSRNLSNIFDLNIDKKFYTLNRKIRNNIHYCETIVLTDNELNLVDINQNKYLKILLDEFDKVINIDIDDECIKITNFLEYCDEKGLTEKEILKNYPLNYIKFCFMKRLQSFIN